MDEWIKVAELGKPFALKGEVKARSLTSFPELRFTKGRKLLAKPEVGKGEERILTLRSYRSSGESLTFLFEEIGTPEEASALRGLSLYIRKEEAPLPEGYYRLEDLKGLACYDQDGNLLGKVVDTMQNAPVLNLVVEKEEGGRFTVPFLDKKFILDLDLAQGKIVIQVIPGLL